MKRGKKLRLVWVEMTFLVIFLYCLLGRGLVVFERTGENWFTFSLNGYEVGVLGDTETAEELLWQARRAVAAESEELIFLEAELSYVGEELLWGKVDDEETVLVNMEQVLRDSVEESLNRCYTVKVGEYTVNLASTDEVRALLQAMLAKYDTEGIFTVELVHNTEREFNVLTTNVVRAETASEDAEGLTLLTAGLYAEFSQAIQAVISEESMSFADYELGLLSIDFDDEVKVVEAYLPQSQISSLEQAVADLTNEEETETVYVVQSGDTLSEIALEVNIPMETIVAMNDFLEDENSTLHIGDELVITVPEPALSVVWQVEYYSEESYDEDVIYIDEDSWYTTRTEVVQQPSAGYRKTISISTYQDDTLLEREIVKEEIVVEAVAKIVRRGTIVPPTYIKPVSGGRKSSGFGPRSRPTAGATTYHKGVDWAVPTGTSVYASSGGTVVKAGWGGNYGYVIYINHPDGRQTRYAHLSKILVSVGQTVSQGEKIALSGNTGNTTGPHLHFEILINGVQVDPEKYLN